MRYLVMSLMLAAPLSAQIPETITIEPAVVNFAPNILPAPVEVMVQGMSNEDVVAAIDRQTAAFAAAQPQPATQSTIERVGTKVAWFGLGVLAVYFLKQLVDKDHPPHPAHDPHPDHPDHAEHPSHPDHPDHDPHAPHPEHPSHPSEPDHPEHPSHPEHPDPPEPEPYR